jgi:uncharacterized protein YkwD
MEAFMFRVFAFAFLMLGCVAGEATASVRVSGSSTSEAFEWERETFALINEYRKVNHLESLTWDTGIAAVARAHSEGMASGRVDFGHDGFDARVHLLRESFPGLRGAGENVLMTDDPSDVARKAVALWLKSPPHLHNIRGDFSNSGIGISENAQGVIYFTQVFVKIGPATETTQAGPRIMMPLGFLSTATGRTVP